MSRRVSRIGVALLALSLIIPTTTFAATRDAGAEPVSPASRIIQKIKKVVKSLLPDLHDEGVVFPKPPGG